MIRLMQIVNGALAALFVVVALTAPELSTGALWVALSLAALFGADAYLLGRAA